MPPVGETLTLPAIHAVFSGKRLAGSVVGGAQILRDFPRFIRLAETGLLDLGSMISQRIKLTTSAPERGCNATHRFPRKGASTTSSARSCGSSVTLGGT